MWGKLGMGDGKHSSGVIVGGTDKGSVCVWDASKLIMQESDSQILTLDKHVGSVGALDFNKYQVCFYDLFLCSPIHIVTNISVNRIIILHKPT